MIYHFWGWGKQKSRLSNEAPEDVKEPESIPKELSTSQLRHVYIDEIFV